MDYDSIKSFIKESGTRNQYERYEVGKLPLAELEELVGDFLFSETSQFERMPKRREIATLLHEMLDIEIVIDDISMLSETVDDLSAEQWDAIRQIRESNTKYTIELEEYIVHKIYYQGDEVLRKYVVKLGISWCGEEWTREYELPEYEDLYT